ncbi:MAG: hypothetical protein HC783_01730 [Rhodobacteraceae bacterium]|nr:hypothetical protein [Paracoccaceae bacterium]
MNGILVPIASLGMYDFGPAMAANDRLWAGLRGRLRAVGVAAPDALTRGEGAFWPAWEAPNLLLSQTCGYPFRARLVGRVTYVGTPDYGVEGCAPGQYRSVFVVRRDDPAESALLQELMRRPTALVAWERDLRHARAALAVMNFDVVVADTHLPDGSGCL